MVSASPSSAERMMTLPSGARPSPHGHSPPVVIAPMIAIEIWLFPAPGSPAMHVCLPRAMRPGQSHSPGNECAAFWGIGASPVNRCAFDQIPKLFSVSALGEPIIDVAFRREPRHA
jgi:hypothetical protein